MTADPSLKLDSRTRRTLGRSHRWPAGALAGCEVVDRAAGGDWFTIWLPGGSDAFPRAGFYALTPEASRDEPPVWLHGASPQELLDRIRGREPPR